MRVSIDDSAPGCGPARNTYLEARAIRALEAYASRIDAVELSISVDHGLHEGRLVVRAQGATPVVLATKGRRMVGVLAIVFDAADDRLRALFPALRPRGEAV